MAGASGRGRASLHPETKVPRPYDHVHGGPWWFTASFTAAWRCNELQYGAVRQVAPQPLLSAADAAAARSGNRTSSRR